jgi:glucosamine--fructose-6-phosphate aminotransferase (isomerizing)
VSYVTALAALAKLVARMAGAAGAPLAAALTTVPEAIEKTLAMPAPVVPAERLVGREPILVTGYGRDAVTADEAALKLKEGAYRWAEGMPIELALHGPPAALRKDMAAITITPAGDDAGRTATLRAFLGDMRITALTCGDADEDLAFYPVPPLVRPLVSIVPLQRLTAEVARKLGANPDRAHRESEPWGSAMVRHQL